MVNLFNLDSPLSKLRSQRVFIFFVSHSVLSGAEFFSFLIFRYCFAFKLPVIPASQPSALSLELSASGFELPCFALSALISHNPSVAHLNHIVDNPSLKYKRIVTGD